MGCEVYDVDCRRPSFLVRTALGDGLDFADADLDDGWARYVVDWSASGAPFGTLRVGITPARSTGDFALVAEARQRDTTPLGTRYLDEDDMGLWTLSGEIAGAPYVGDASAASLHIDLQGTGALYLTLAVRLLPVGHVGPSFAGVVEVQGFDHFFECEAPPTAPDTVGLPSPSCDPIVQRLWDTPDDPDAPPLPWAGCDG